MKPPALTEYVHLYSVTQVADTMGGSVETETDLGAIGADWRPISGREYLAGNTLAYGALVRVTIRYRSDITQTMRLKRDRDSLTYEIVGIREIERGQWMELDVMARNI